MNKKLFRDAFNRFFKAIRGSHEGAALKTFMGFFYPDKVEELSKRGIDPSGKENLSYWEIGDYIQRFEEAAPSSFINLCKEVGCPYFPQREGFNECQRFGSSIQCPIYQEMDMELRLEVFPSVGHISGLTCYSPLFKEILNDWLEGSEKERVAIHKEAHAEERSP